VHARESLATRHVSFSFQSGSIPVTNIFLVLRKSTRTHTTVDYAGLNEGVLRQSDDHPEHHYIEPIKNGSIPLIPESFPRMKPEDITAEFFDKCINFCEPILIPAALNPRPNFPGRSSSGEGAEIKQTSRVKTPVVPTAAQDAAPARTLEPAEIARLLEVVPDATHDPTSVDDYEVVPDDGQDKLDMVIPQGLTVRRVAELYGPENHVPVIDVKSQESEGKKWTVGKWADYYESTGDKVIRNVISLEVSRTPFGRLIRRPKVVRDLDLQDSVWPKHENRKSVGFYCLMSVADSYTDFHIDFGGSSVYYHILKGRKVFFFIPPTKSNLQKYEDWNVLPSQNWTWLPDQTKTKECYRVDLYPGDTMLIPSGWIHAVWTPEDSLVIGGNFLTRLHYEMQFKVAEIERNNKTGIAFRYPKFQKVMWYTIIKYMDEDPLPSAVRDVFNQGQQFKRSTPIWREFNKFGHNSDPGLANYHARYYPKAELEGLPQLVSYIFRTVLIHLDCLEGITQGTRKAVSDSIPKNVEPLETARSFAMWAAWKRGNEDIPQWAHPDSVLPTRSDGDSQKKLSNAQLKRLERATAIPAPERQSVRIKTANEISTTPKTSTLGPRRTACDACRKRKMRCKHIEASGSGSSSGSPGQGDFSITSPLPGVSTLLGVYPSPPSRHMANPLDPHDTLETQPSLGLLADNATLDGSSGYHLDTSDGKKGRTKACDECRRSKVSAPNSGNCPLRDMLTDISVDASTTSTGTLILLKRTNRLYLAAPPSER
jgi:F-box/leucine-rich repeat protein 10/11